MPQKQTLYPVLFSIAFVPPRVPTSVNTPTCARLAKEQAKESWRLLTPPVDAIFMVFSSRVHHRELLWKIGAGRVALGQQKASSS